MGLRNTLLKLGGMDFRNPMQYAPGEEGVVPRPEVGDCRISGGAVRIVGDLVEECAAVGTSSVAGDELVTGRNCAGRNDECRQVLVNVRHMFGF